jgi:diguanylate cyclase (GGDEF)-like protein
MARTDIDTDLEIITNETKNIINKMSIVTPSIYSSLFSKNAKAHNQSFDDECNLSKEILQNECAFLSDMQKKTGENASRLTQHTKDAISAIKTKNEELLDTVLKETETLKNEIEKLRSFVYQDELTHTYNRKWLHDNFLDNEDINFTQDGLLVLLDLNYFKIINDTHGHVIGDKVLIFMAKHLKTLCSNTIRYGGDEFLLIFPSHTNIDKTLLNLENLREHIIKTKLKAHNEMFTLSFSFGVTPFNENMTLSEAIENADREMYKDKLKIKEKIKGI